MGMLDLILGKDRFKPAYSGQAKRDQKRPEVSVAGGVTCQQAFGPRYIGLPEQFRMSAIARHEKAVRDAQAVLRKEQEKDRRRHDIATAIDSCARMGELYTTFPIGETRGNRHIEENDVQWLKDHGYIVKRCKVRVRVVTPSDWNNPEKQRLASRDGAKISWGHE